ncbi:DUF6265 family protein [Conexibacter sp. CPCC 206217]|uniref:DUF6265 family protein n=1 Tax=Conexibacter sp. CPCC 206217 TaxID=3064574 RepID=UPI002727634D|nr:DUF6265 family protein [Conexibacter sp. CPCC 206217]MDO8210244.1 DUF6265 family protein [Conexibacter sp. CPCC 206217]
MTNHDDEAPLDALAFMVGRWIGARSQDAIEETWTRVSRDVMMGMYCWSGPGGVQLFEFLTIEPSPSGVMLSLRAFGPHGLAPRQVGRPVRWLLVRSRADEAIFEGQEDGRLARITYRRTHPDRLYTSLEREADGRMEIFPQQHRAAPLQAPAPADRGTLLP